MNDLIMAITYWAYVAFLPMLVLAFLYFGFIQRKD